MSNLSYKKYGNELILLNNNKEFLTEKGNKIIFSSLKIAKKVLVKASLDNSNYKSNFFKLLFYSNNLNSKKKKILSDTILRFTDTDLICYRAIKGSKLEREQKKKWDPYIKFCFENYGLNFTTTNSIMPIIYNNNNKKIISKIIDEMNSYILTTFFFLVETTASIGISLKIINNKVSTKRAWDDSNLEYGYNSTIWGTDPEEEKKLLLKKKFFIDIIDFVQIIK